MTLTERIKKLIESLGKNRKMMTAAAVIGMVGLLMILFSGGEKKNDDSSEEIQQTAADAEWTDYCTSAESRLEKLLSSIDGVGKAKVMITVSSSEEYIYAQTKKTKGESSEQEYVTVRTSNGEEALLRTVNTPVIKGVAIVCEGGRSDRVREEVYRTVTSVLDIPSNKIYVAAME